MQGIGIVAAVLVAIALLATQSPSYQACQNKNHNEAKAQNPEAEVGWAFEARNFVPCEGEFIDQNEGNLTLFATCFIALFTYTLWRSTSELADFAEKQSDDTNRSLDLSDKALEAARITAGANELIANFAGRSVENQWAALQVARESVSVAQESAGAAKIAANAATLQVKELKRSVDIAMNAERAYVKLSHVQPGIIFSPNGTVLVQIQAMNLGRTPASLEGTYLRIVTLHNGMKLPDIPDYLPDHFIAREAVMGAGGDPVFQTWDSNIGIDGYPDIRNGTIPMVIFGYVDYRDIFGNPFRGGYARRFDSYRDKRITADDVFNQRTNLVMLEQRGYNYDRARRVEQAGHPDG